MVLRCLKMKQGKIHRTNNSDCKIELWEESFDAEDAAAYDGLCADEIELSDEIQTNRVCRDENIFRKLPNFPDGKDKHYFVAYSSKDWERVREIIEEVENRFEMVCVMADRDFHSGKNTLVNIYESMQRSMKVLLMMSLTFVSSSWCKHELETAMMDQIDSGINRVVPVLLEKCDIPKALRNVNYIDATLPGVDIPARIADALTQSELAGGQPNLHMQNQTKRYENGFCVPIVAKRKPLCRYRPSIYRFSLDKNVLYNLQRAKITLPLHVLDDAFSDLNRNSKVWGYGYTCYCKMLIWIILSIPLWIFLFIFVIACVSHSSHAVSPETVNNTILGVVIAAILLLILISIFPCFTIICDTRKVTRDLQSRLWTKHQQACLKNNVFLLYDQCWGSAPTLFVMRYNIKQCQDYIEGLIRSRVLACADGLQPAEYAEKLIEDHARHYQRILTPRMANELPDDPENRHNVKNGKMCLCQYITSFNRVL